MLTVVGPEGVNTRHPFSGFRICGGAPEDEQVLLEVGGNGVQIRFSVFRYRTPKV